ncbi:hypothetical protein SAMN05216553_101525 [Lentzea fradiae]|uniref:Uncharacterized protein n=1 Tax=Lentzea fradiae TaxID=200378 RepID=A0A1G7KWQ3_9PSEU|nr:hypothetical protein [Lentzea fradiae]SDF41516.1 hypothetical protein SAMN05216553_101525 [Lentzea fradiae]
MPVNEQVLAVAERMTGLPWPRDDERLDWEVDGFTGWSGFLAHVLPLTGMSPFGRPADRRWGVRDRAPAGLARALGADDAAWWRYGDHAIVLTGAAVHVVPLPWLTGPDPGEHAHRSPLIAAFLSGDARRVLGAVWTVFRTRDPEVLTPLVKALPAIEKATDLDLGGALASNNDNLDHVLGRIRLFREGTCLCTAYLSHLFYDPEKEGRHVLVVGTVPNDRQWVPDRLCECRDCGRRFQVEQGEHHYTWWKWTALTTP